MKPLLSRRRIAWLPTVVALGLVVAVAIALSTQRRRPVEPPPSPVGTGPMFMPPPLDTGDADGRPKIIPPAFKPKATSVPQMRAADEKPSEPAPQPDEDRAERERSESALAQQWPDIPRDKSAKMTDEIFVDIMVGMVHAYDRYMSDSKKTKDVDGFAEASAKLFDKHRIAEGEFQDYLAQLSHDGARRDRLRQAVVKRLQKEAQPGKASGAIMKLNEKTLKELGLDISTEPRPVVPQR